MSLRLLARVLITMIVTMPLASAAISPPAPPFDHLQCFPVKDALPRGSATADLVPAQGAPFAPQPGCKIKLPARYYCTDVSKQNLDPAAKLPISGDDARDYLCYTVACGKGARPAPASQILVSDQFGSRTVATTRRTRQLCVPAVRTQPTPTPSPVVTPTVVVEPPCSFDGQECQGTCQTGRCVYDPDQNRCFCPQAFDAACDQFAQGVCAGHFCFGPGEVCVPGAQPTLGLGCACVNPTPTPAPTP